jgi:hypothetical protein
MALTPKIAACLRWRAGSGGGGGKRMKLGTAARDGWVRPDRPVDRDRRQRARPARSDSLLRPIEVTISGIGTLSNPVEPQ